MSTAFLVQLKRALVIIVQALEQEIDTRKNGNPTTQ